MKKMLTIFVATLMSFTLIAGEKQSMRLENALYFSNMNDVALAAALGLDAESELQLVRETQVGKTTIKRYQQYYMGARVFGESIIERKDGNGVSTFHGRKVVDIANGFRSNYPAMNDKDALSSMKAHQKGNSARDARWVYENEKSELVLYTDDQGTSSFAYLVSFFADDADFASPTRPHYIVDAETGEILKQWEGLTHTEVGTGPGGNQKTGQYEYGTDFGYMDVAVNGGTYTMNNADVKTVDLNHGTSGSTAYSYAGPRNTRKQINGAYSPLNDAHFFGGVVFNMFNNWVGQPPLTFQLTMRVHYSSNYENAFWNGSSMTFGDGLNTFYPLVSLDVSGHEVAHGFTEQNSNLIYSGQSGGINEAFSDMAGEACEAYNNGSNDFLVGAQIFKGNGALRYMQNPPDDGISIGHVDDYNNNMNVHYSSGIYNKAFYTLATTSGWSTQKAFQVMALANQNYWTSSTSFNSGVCGVRDAATDLGFSASDVDAAFAVVGAACSGTGPCGAKGTPCAANDECCSNRCKGRGSNKSCK